MKLTIMGTIYDVDAVRTRAYYESLPYTAPDAVMRNHIKVFNETTTPEQKAVFECLGINAAGVPRDRIAYNEYSKDMQYEYGKCLFGAAPLYPVICKSIRERKPDKSKPHHVISKIAGLMISARPLITFYGMPEFERLLPYYPNVALLSLCIREPWILDEPMPAGLKRFPATGRFSPENIARSMPEAFEIMLDMRGARYEEMTKAQWMALLPRYINTFVNVEKRAQAFAYYNECMEQDPGEMIQKHFSMWFYLESDSSQTVLAGDEAEAELDACPPCDYTIGLDMFGFAAFRTHGRPPMARQLKRFGNKDLYIIADDLSWIFARNHEGYDPRFVRKTAESD